MILVVGATGMLGGTIVRRLLERDEEVRALVRDPAGEKLLKKAGADTASGDLKDPASLRAACEGISTLITTANSVARGGDDNMQTVDLDGNRNLIEAASRSGVEHFIFVSAQGEDAESPVPFLRAKGITSRRLRESGMAYTVLMPDAYMDVWIPLVVLMPAAAEQPITLVGEGIRKHYFIAVDDVAGYAVGAVRNDAAVDGDFLIGGPAPLSWHDVISAFESVKGVSLEIQSLQAGAPMPGFPDGASGFMTVLETYDSPEPISSAEAERIFGVRLTTVDDFMRRQAG
jgi:uncharacterized protein YbjT (DUF2867 family)